MRGGMLVDAVSGSRLERNQSRGVRVSRVGFVPDRRDRMLEALKEMGLDAVRVAEAISLATKVQHHPDIVAELCWSDDPSYTTGYVAANGVYTRITPLKNRGDLLGGRAFFLRPECSLESVIDFLEKTPFLVTDIDTLIRLVERGR